MYCSYPEEVKKCFYYPELPIYREKFYEQTGIQKYASTQKLYTTYNMSENIKIIIDFKNVLSDAEWEEMKARFIQKKLKKDAIITAEGQTEKYLYFIEQGVVRKYYLANGIEYNIDFRFENQFVSSYASFLTQQPSNIFLKTIEDATLLAIKFKSLQELYRMSKSGERLGRLYAEELFIEKKLREATLMTQSPKERYSNLLAQKPHWIKRVPLYMIASYLNIAPETLSRVRKEIK